MAGTTTLKPPSGNGSNRVVYPYAATGLLCFNCIEVVLSKHSFPMEQQPRAYKHFRWIIADPEWLGGKPAIRGTRLSVAHVLECLSAGMDLDEINQSFGGGVSAEALAEALQVAAELTDKPCVAA